MIHIRCKDIDTTLSRDISNGNEISLSNMVYDEFMTSFHTMGLPCHKEMLDLSKEHPLGMHNY